MLSEIERNPGGKGIPQIVSSQVDDATYTKICEDAGLHRETANRWQLEAEKAKANLVTSTGGSKSRPLQKSVKAVDTRQELAKLTRVSHDTMACYTQEEIAEAVGISRAEIENQVKESTEMEALPKMSKLSALFQDTDLALWGISLKKQEKWLTCQIWG